MLLIERTGVNVKELIFDIKRMNFCLNKELDLESIWDGDILKLNLTKEEREELEAYLKIIEKGNK